MLSFPATKYTLNDNMSSKSHTHRKCKSCEKCWICDKTCDVCRFAYICWKCDGVHYADDNCTVEVEESSSDEDTYDEMGHWISGYCCGRDCESCGRCFYGNRDPCDVCRVGRICRRCDMIHYSKECYECKR